MLLIISLLYVCSATIRSWTKTDENVKFSLILSCRGFRGSVIYLIYINIQYDRDKLWFFFLAGCPYLCSIVFYLSIDLFYSFNCDDRLYCYLHIQEKKKRMNIIVLYMY